MKFLVVAASALAFAATPALAGGWGGSNYGGSPQFANSSALNFAKQMGTIKAQSGHSKHGWGKSVKSRIDQMTGASAEAINKSSCGCKGKQVAKAFAKNNSFQTAKIYGVGTITQSAVSSALAKNVRGGGHY